MRQRRGAAGTSNSKWSKTGTEGEASQRRRRGGGSARPLTYHKFLKQRYILPNRSYWSIRAVNDIVIIQNIRLVNFEGKGGIASVGASVSVCAVVASDGEDRGAECGGRRPR